MIVNTFRHFLCVLFLTALAAGGGCGGGGGDGDSSGDAPVASAGDRVSGPADPVQDDLTGVGGSDVGPTTDGSGDPPAGGGDSSDPPSTVDATAAGLTSEMVVLLDAPDALVTGLQAFLISQDPGDLVAGGTLTADALLRFAGGLGETLAQSPIGGIATPASDLVVATLFDLRQALQGGLIDSDGGAHLNVLTGLLGQLDGRLHNLANLVPDPLQDAPLVGALLAALGDGAGDLASFLEAVAQLDADLASAELVEMFVNVEANLTSNVEIMEALPLGFAEQLDATVEKASGTFKNGLGLLLHPLFQALRGVLDPVTNAGVPPLAGILGGVIGGNLSGLGGFSGLTQRLAGGGLSPLGTAIPTLSGLLAGLPLLGDLLAALPPVQGVPGGDIAGGLPLLGTLLAGGEGLPLLGDVLQSIPGLTGGGGGPVSLPVLGDFLTALFSLNGDGLPIIGTVLEAAGGAGNLDTGVLGTVLDGLLDNLLGIFGSAGVGGVLGFLDGSEGLPLPLDGIVEGLLGNLLGPLGLLGL